LVVVNLEKIKRMTAPTTPTKKTWIEELPPSPDVDTDDTKSKVKLLLDAAKMAATYKFNQDCDTFNRNQIKTMAMIIRELREEIMQPQHKIAQVGQTALSEDMQLELRNMNLYDTT